LHIQRGDFIGKNDLELGFPEELVKGNPEKGIRGFWADDRLVMESGKTQVYPNDPATIDGVVHTFHTIKTPLRDKNGNIWGVLAFARDVTDREQAQAQMQETLRELERLYRAATREGWQAFLKTGQLATGYVYDRLTVQPAENVWVPQIEQAIQQHTLVPPSVGNAVAVTPLSVRGEIVGALGVYDDPQRPLSPDELALLQEITEQGALALENARLYQDTQRRAAQEQLVSEVTARMRETLDLDTVLQTAIREMGEALGMDAVEVRMRMRPDGDNHGEG
jgi:transcriptional regulator of acetoin/glycerol metabolism